MTIYRPSRTGPTMSSADLNPPTSPEAQASLDVLVRALRSDARRISITGLKGAARAHLLARLRREGLGPFVCVTAGEDEADTLAGDLGFFLGKGEDGAPSILRLPGDGAGTDEHVGVPRAALQFNTKPLNIVPWR
jgi:hypothetical protein